MRVGRIHGSKAIGFKNDGIGLMLPLIGTEIEELVLFDGPSHGSAKLFVGVRQYLLLDWVRGIESVIAKIPEGTSVRCVRPRLRLNVDLQRIRSALRRVETVSDDLKLRDRILAELRLSITTGICVVLRNLLAVHIQLKAGDSPCCKRRIIDGIHANAGHQ